MYVQWASNRLMSSYCNSALEGLFCFLQTRKSFVCDLLSNCSHTLKGALKQFALERWCLTGANPYHPQIASKDGRQTVAGDSIMGTIKA